MHKSKVFLKGLLFAFLMLLFTSCKDEKTLEQKRSAFIETVEEKQSEIELSYHEGDKLIQKLSDGTLVQWITTGDVSNYFVKDKSTGEITCTGVDNEDGAILKITARFIKKGEKSITYDKEYEFNILDNKIRNTEKGIPDPAFFSYMTVVADTNKDGKISYLEASELTGDVVIKKDLEGIVAGERIESTKGLNHFPNINKLKFDNLKISNLIVDSVTNLETLEVATSYSTIINSMSISNMEHLELVEISDEVSITSFEVGNNINLIELNLSNKSLREFKVSDISVTIYKLNLSGNDELIDLSNLANIYQLEELRLSKSGLTDESANSIPTLPSLKTLDLSQNRSISKFSFVTCDKFPALEVLNLKSNALSELYLEGFQNLKALELEQARPDDNLRIKRIKLSNLTSFTSFNRSKEIKISNLELINIPLLSTLDLSSDDNNLMDSLIIESCGIKEFKNTHLFVIKSVFKSLPIETLDLQFTVKETIVLEDMQGLKTLILNNTTVESDLSFINGAPNLVNLSLSNVNLKESMLDGVKSKTTLKNLDLSENKDISNYEFLTKFGNLEILDLTRNNLNDNKLNTLPKLIKLKELYLSYNSGLKNIRLESLDNLQKLDIATSELANSNWYLDSLELVNLKSFNNLVRTSSTKIKKILLQDLPSLKALDLSNCELEELRPVNIRNLTDLDISGDNFIKIH